MRGNPRTPPAKSWAAGSIPAHAGEPRAYPCTPGVTRVYPRACGGTKQGSVVGDLGDGLSPRMRGNHLMAIYAHQTVGSIPAHAGEPEHFEAKGYHVGVYPRACGGTWGARWAAAKAQGLSPRMRGNLGVRP